MTEQREMHATGAAVSEFMQLMQEELNSAEEKFPWWPDDIVHGVAIMGEEAGEAVQAALAVVYDRKTVMPLERELIQTAAMALRAWIGLREERRVT